MTDEWLSVVARLLLAAVSLCYSKLRGLHTIHILVMAIFGDGHIDLPTAANV